MSNHIKSQSTTTWTAPGSPGRTQNSLLLLVGQQYDIGEQKHQQHGLRKGNYEQLRKKTFMMRI